MAHRLQDTGYSEQVKVVDQVLYKEMQSDREWQRRRGEKQRRNLYIFDGWIIVVPLSLVYKFQVQLKRSGCR